MTTQRFRTVILDADSTLAGLEGIDWLAERRGPEVAAAVAANTEAAMNGHLPLESVYATRLALVAPSQSDLLALGKAYVAALAADAVDVLAEGRQRGIHWIIVSGGLRPALLHLAAALAVPPQDLFGVDVHTDAAGNYVGFDSSSPLARQGGKPQLVASLRGLHAPILAVGDGSTDAELRRVTNAFWCYAGFVHRPSVATRADKTVSSFAELREALWETH